VKRRGDGEAVMRGTEEAKRRGDGEARAGICGDEAKRGRVVEV
jgi:hypothetical protein